MPCGENNMSATRFCTLGGNRTRSFGHHAPDAPNPSIVCAGAAATRTTVRSAGVAIVVVVFGAGRAACFDEEHDVTNTETAKIAMARRIHRELISRAREGLFPGSDCGRKGVLRGTGVSAARVLDEVVESMTALWTRSAVPAAAHVPPDPTGAVVGRARGAVPEIGVMQEHVAAVAIHAD